MISFPPLGEEDRTEGPMVIEAEVGGHLVYRMYVDEGASLEILEYTVFKPNSAQEIRSQISHSPYNGIIGRLGVRRIKEIPSTAHGMLKFPMTCGTVTLRSSRIIPLECAMISGSTLTEEDRKKLCGLLSQLAVGNGYLSNGYLRKGQNQSENENRAREQKDREKSKRQSQSQPRELALEKASKTEPENLNCQKWAHPYPPSGPESAH
ncbi:hypothetical protein Tco_0732321 [Tanacetum coccineum]